jgi:WD40 repeat protein
MNELNDFEWDGGGDDESFKSALESSIIESFTAYSICVNPLSLNIALSDDSEFEDALSEEESENDHDNDNGNDDSIQNIYSYTGGCNGATATEERNKDRPIVENEATEDGSGAQPTVVIPSNAQTKLTRIPESTIHTTKRPNINSLAFNQDKDCIAFSTSTGYQIQTLETNPNEPYQIHKMPMRGGTNCIQILHRTSLLAIVKSKTPRILSIIHARTARIVKELSFTSAVRRVEMNKLCMVVLTANGELHVFVLEKGDIEFVESIGILHESESARTVTAEGAVMQGTFFELSSHLMDGCAWLVTKSMEKIGFVSIYRICTDFGQAGMELVKTFSAHNHAIGKIAIGGIANDNAAQTVFATASAKGTIIRVFSLSHCEKLYELQRGSSPCTIYSMSFNADVTMLAVSGSKGTVHLFHLTEENQVNSVQDESTQGVALKKGFSNMMKRFTSKSKDDTENIVRSFVRIRLKGEHSKVANTVAMLKTVESEDGDKEDDVAICLGDGKLFQYAVRHNGKKRPTRADDLMARKNSD